jgi:hypothetical protein
MRSRAVPLVAAAASLLLAGCASGSSGGGGSAAGTPDSAGASSTAAGGSSTAAASSSSAAGGSRTPQAGCPSVGRAIPSGAKSKQTIDVDGDGRPDTEWIAGSPDANGGVRFGIRTASGGVFAATITSASPVARSVMFADVTGHGEIIALASDGRQVLLYAVSDCQLIPEKNLQGKQYAFDLGFTGFGTGVGCVDANGDGTTDLVGLKYVPESQGQGTIRRTIVTLNGPNARNGATDTVPASNANLAAEAQSVTCGDQSLKENGVSSGP